MTRQATKIPNPGSNEAIAQGCICAVMDNHYGKGFPVNGETVFYITENCPVHDAPKIKTFTLPIKTVSESNQREHWAVRAKRAKEQRLHAYVLTWAQVPRCFNPDPMVITLTRIGKRRLDTGNLSGSMKAVQDGLCDALKIDDGDPAHEWKYEQRIGKEYAVEVKLEARK